METGFLSSGLLFRTNFVLAEAIIQIKIKLFLESNLSPIIGNHFLRLFRCSCQWKEHFCVVETKPLFYCIFHSDWWNQKFCLVEKLFFYLQLFSCLWKPLLALNSVSVNWNEGLFWKILFHCMEQPNQYWILRNYWQEYMKNREKKWFLLAKIRNFPPAKISFFLKNYFPLIPIIVSTCRKTSLIQCFHQTENPFLLSG